MVATLEARGVEDLRELEQLRETVADMRSARRRLVLADDADRHGIERELHRGLQQDLVALSTSLQLAAGLADQPVANAVLDEAISIVEEALDDARRLADRISPPLLEAGGLAVALRSAAAIAGIRARINIDATATYPAPVARTIYLCSVAAFDGAIAGSEAVIATRSEELMLAFDVVAECELADVDIVRLRDRVEALGGQLTIAPGADGGTRALGSLPLPGS